MDSELKLPKIKEPLVWGWVTAPLKDANKNEGTHQILGKDE